MKLIKYQRIEQGDYKRATQIVQLLNSQTRILSGDIEKYP